MRVRRRSEACFGFARAFGDRCFTLRHAGRDVTGACGLRCCCFQFSAARTGSRCNIVFARQHLEDEPAEDNGFGGECPPLATLSDYLGCLLIVGVLEHAPERQTPCTCVSLVVHGQVVLRLHRIRTAASLRARYFSLHVGF